MISVTVLAKNSEETLEKTLEALSSFPEVLVLDTGSTDSTMDIARSFPNVKVVEAPFQGFGKTHNMASSLASYDWIFSVDSDEVVSRELSEEILSKELNPERVYAVRRKNFLYGKEIKGCSGWNPDWVLRLYHRKKTSFNQAEVHETIVLGSLKRENLTYTMSHTPYRKVSDFLEKMQVYTELFAQQHRGRKSSSLLKAIFRGWVTFFKSYILKRGILCGAEGFLISAYNGHVAFYKYLKLKEENAQNSR